MTDLQMFFVFSGKKDNFIINAQTNKNQYKVNQWKRNKSFNQPESWSKKQKFHTIF